MNPEMVRNESQKIERQNKDKENTKGQNANHLVNKCEGSLPQENSIAEAPVTQIKEIVKKYFGSSVSPSVDNGLDDSLASKNVEEKNISFRNNGNKV